MSKNRRQPRHSSMVAPRARPRELKLESAVVERETVDALRRVVDELADAPPPRGPREHAEHRAGAGLTQPSWSITQRYLTHGEYRAWVEGYAEASVAFADVLEALRQDHRARLDRDRERRRRGREQRAPLASERGERIGASSPEEEKAAEDESIEPPRKNVVSLKPSR